MPIDHDLRLLSPTLDLNLVSGSTTDVGSPFALAPVAPSGDMLNADLELGDALRNQEVTGAAHRPERVVGMVHDGVLERADQQLALAGVRRGAMRHRLGQADGEAHVHAKGRMAHRGQAGGARIALPAPAVSGIELPGLADVVTERAGDQEVAVDLQVRQERAHLLGDAQARRVTPRM